MGVGSILKSPLCTISPAGVEIASATESGVEWVTRIGSTPNGPSSKRRRGSIVFMRAPIRPSSSRRRRAKASVTAVP